MWGLGIYQFPDLGINPGCTWIGIGIYMLSTLPDVLRNLWKLRDYYQHIDLTELIWLALSDWIDLLSITWHEEIQKKLYWCTLYVFTLCSILLRSDDFWVVHFLLQFWEKYKIQNKIFFFEIINLLQVFRTLLPIWWKDI